MDRPPLSNDTIDSVLRHWEVGRAKNLSAPARSLRHDSFWMKMFRKKKNDYKGVYYDDKNDPTLIKNSTFKRYFRSKKIR